MRGAFSLFIRWICSLTLLVAAMPLKASEAPCVMPLPKTKQVCKMACCEGMNAGAAMACGKHSSKAVRAKPVIEAPKAPCACETKAAPSVQMVAERAIVPHFDLVGFIATRPAITPDLRETISAFEPGIVGTDSGPPPNFARSADRGRAPPVA